MSFAPRPGTVVPGSEISQAERAVRADLAATYRLAALNSWDDLVYIHLSATISNETDHFLINAFDLAFDEITASNLIRINGRGRLVGDWPEGIARPSVNVAGFALRATVYAARPNAQCVVHLHNTAGIAVSAQKHGLLLLSQHVLRFRRHVVHHNYEGLASMPEKGTHLTTPLDSYFAMLLRDHGTLIIGRIMTEAHVLTATFIKAYEIQIQTQIQAQAGGEVVSPAPHVANCATKQLEDGDAIEGVIEWPALLRRLDKTDTSYHN